MTVPDTGARAFTLTPGQPAKLLTSTAGGPDAPATVISDNVAGCRVYLGADGGVSQSTGVPLDPGTSQPWTTEGQLWAFADPTASPAAPASIRLTSAIDEWQPSPVAIAAQLATLGVPNVMTSTVIANNAPIPLAGKTYDVHAYASVFVEGNQGLNYTFLDDAGNIVDGDYLYAGFGATLAVVGTQLNLVPHGGAGVVSLTGFNRPALSRYGMGAPAFALMTPISFGTVSRTWAVGDLLPLYTNVPGYNVARLSGLTPGRYWLEWHPSSVAAKGRIEILPDTSAYAVADTIVLADSTELTVSGTSSIYGAKYVTIPFAGDFEFFSYAAWTGAVRGTLIYEKPIG